MTKLVRALLLFALFMSEALGLSCRECTPEMREGGCGVREEDCRFGIEKDQCDCCNACLKGERESCGGRLNFEGNCGKYMECMYSVAEYKNGMAGVCRNYNVSEPDRVVVEMEVTDEDKFSYDNGRRLLTNSFRKEIKIPSYKIVTGTTMLETWFTNPNDGETKCINAFHSSRAKTVSIEITKKNTTCHFYNSNLHDLQIQYIEDDDATQFMVLAKEMYFDYWFSHIDFQFYAFNSGNHSFSTAKENCQAHNGKLAILKTDLQMKAFVEFITHSLGLKESGSYFIDLTFNMHSNSVVWGDGTPFKESTITLVDENKTNMRNKMYVAVFQNGALIEYRSLFNRNDYDVIPGIAGVCQMNPFNV